MSSVGSRAQVYHGTAMYTSGGLTKKDLTMSKRGEIVSKRKQTLAKKKSNPLSKYITLAKKTEGGGEFIKMHRLPDRILKKIKK